ncbi:twin-arginine translocase subunit TatC [Microbacterium sp. NPDC056569]|uniref:twin-arginine translocase subunit TatC n=1 Tax=Microbacterium sp. NPDC056569 TaxID=3345867 RepID=UPI003672322E
MTLGGHLAELRRRLLIAAVALVAGMVVAFVLTDPIIFVLTEPIRVVAASRGDEFAVLNFETVTSAFDLRLRIAFSVGLLISAPVWLWQVWAFLVPGLSRREIRNTVGFLSAAIPLFFAGCVTGLLIMPHIVEMMATFVPEQGAQFYTASFYYDFIFKLLIIVGISFVLPVFLVALNLAGVVSGRTIVKGWRLAVVVAAVFAALATPAADVASMLMLGGALVVLFFAAAGLSLLFDHRRSRRQAAGEREFA